MVQDPKLRTPCPGEYPATRLAQALSGTAGISTEVIAAADLARSQRRFGLIAATICTSAVGTTMGLIWPLLSLLLAQRAADGTLIGFNAAAQTSATLIVSPFAPWLFGRFGIRRALGGCIVLIVGALLLLKLFEDPRAWLPIRFVLGAAVVVLFVGTQTWVNRLAPEHARGRIIGMFGFLWAAAYALGPLTLLVAALLVILAGLPLCFASDADSGVGYAGGRRSLRGLLRLLGSSTFVAAIALGLCDSVSISFLPVYGLRNGLDQGQAVSQLIAVEVGVLASQLPAGWASDRFDRHRLLLGLAVGALIACLLLPFGVDRPVLLWPILFLLGTATGGVWTVSLILLGQLFQNEDLGGASASRSTLYGIGSVSGPLLAGYALDHWGKLSLPIVLSAVFLALVLSCLALGRKRNRPPA
jgi:MFS family permease